MGQRRIYEVQYTDFSAMLRVATNNGHKIEKPNKEAWMAWVQKHNVPEPAMWSRGKAGTLSGNVTGVIIDGAGEADGYYVYSPAEEFCLKFESGED